MKRRTTNTKDWLPLVRRVAGAGELPTGEGFRPDWIDFEHGIRVGNLEPHERITQILKFHLEQRYRTPFVTDRWGRGVYWQWICWLPRANREAKPVSHDVNFGCAKLFISADDDRRVFKSGLQIERGYMTGPEADKPWGLREDFDWHRLVKQCQRGTRVDQELNRLVRREGFVAAVVGEQATGELTEQNFTGAEQVRTAMRRCAPEYWAGFQLYYPMPEKELRACTGLELVKAICGVFTEVIGVMNSCMQIALVSLDSEHPNEN
jgi:hypothetical protein